MCCQDDQTLDLPPAVIEALAHYRRLVDERGWDWGDEDLPDFFRWARFSRLGNVMAAAAETGDWPSAVRRVVTDDPPAGVVLVHVPDGRITVGRRRLAIPGRPVTLDVVVDSSSDREETLTVAGRTVTVGPRGAEIEVVDLDGAAPVLHVEHDGAAHAVEVAEPVAAAGLRLRTGTGTTARWSVTDPRGGAWFPDGVPHKWDAAHRPYFHAADVALAVPDAELHVRCARGPEFGVVERTVHPGDGGHPDRTVTIDPPRLVDPVAEGWFGGDLHVHLNYSGDLVVTPGQAAEMQAGEGLHLLNLTAGNLSGAHVYDRELLDHTVGRDLWADDDRIARAGVEFRNDLLGHAHALAPNGPPTRYQTGHPGTPHPHDHPPNATACADLRGLDAAVAYAHPAFAPFAEPRSEPRSGPRSTEAEAEADARPEAEPGARAGAAFDDEDPEVGGDGPFGTFFAPYRTVEARELVVDAALGLVDAMDVVSCSDDKAAAFLYRRLLNCGLRLAATAGSDVFLSFAHGPGVASNPPGWCRVYADLAGAPLSAPGFRDAVRAGRTCATNGPFVTLDVDGHGPGALLSAAHGDRLTVTARVRGTGVDTLVLRGPDGVLARGSGTDDVVLRTEVAVDGPLWLAAEARGGPHPDTPEVGLFAHTTPVHVEVDGARVARTADARWCLGFLDRLETLVTEQGRFDPEHRDAQLGELIALVDRARAVYRAVAGQAVGR